MIVSLTIGFLLGVFGVLVGFLLGQHSAWSLLRKERVVRIGDWEYTAIEVFELGSG